HITTQTRRRSRPARRSFRRAEQTLLALASPDAGPAQDSVCKNRTPRPLQRRTRPASTGRELHHQTPETLTDDERFQQLHALATDGNESAAADLWSEYGFTFGE